MAEMYHMYAPKDPHSLPTRPGTRAHDHLVKPDGTRKGIRTQEISRLVTKCSCRISLKICQKLRST